MIKCRVCEVEKPETEFKRTNGGKVDTLCKACFAERQRKWYAENKTRLSVERKIKHLERYAKTQGYKLTITMEQL